MAESCVAEPRVTEPCVTEPHVTEPRGTEPCGTEPCGTEPRVTEPSVTEPHVVESCVTEQCVADIKKTQESNEQGRLNSSAKPRKKVRELYREKVLKLSTEYREKSCRESVSADSGASVRVKKLYNSSVNNGRIQGKSYSTCSDNEYKKTDADSPEGLCDRKSESVEIKVETEQILNDSLKQNSFSCGTVAKASCSTKRANKKPTTCPTNKSVLATPLKSKSSGSSISVDLSDPDDKDIQSGEVDTKVAFDSSSVDIDCKPLNVNTNEKTTITKAGIADNVSGGGVVVQPENGPYVCCECRKSFYEPATLRIHVMKHSGYKMYSCAECFKQFTALSTLRSHMRVHTGEMPYECNICGKKFMFSGNLYKHNHVHSIRPQFMCKICGISVKYSANLHHHMRIHTGETRYRCELCDKQFIMRSGYTAHMRVHIGKKDFKCSVCSRSFMDQSALKSHFRTHSGEQPYSCLQCTRRFSNASNLNRHVRSRHSGLKPYECTQCGKRFTNSNSVRYHDTLHAREKQEETTPQLRKKKVKSSTAG